RTTFHFSFTAPPPTATSTLSLHDALPICSAAPSNVTVCSTGSRLVQRTACPAEMVTASPANFTAVMLTSAAIAAPDAPSATGLRSEEHTSELQSLRHLVCRLLLEKKKNA